LTGHRVEADDQNKAERPFAAAVDLRRLTIPRRIAHGRVRTGGGGLCRRYHLRAPRLQYGQGIIDR
jgi:hypothetical protein